MITTVGSDIKSKSARISKMEIKDKREKEEVPSGIRLMLLLKERLVEIMDLERANQNSIHLYCTGHYWVAFEC